jgi:hypothetical protein
MKKIMVIIGVSLLAVALLVACGKPSGKHIAGKPPIGGSPVKDKKELFAIKPPIGG